MNRIEFLRMVSLLAAGVTVGQNAIATDSLVVTRYRIINDLLKLP